MLEQSFRFDLASPDKILERYVDQKIGYERRNDAGAVVEKIDYDAHGKLKFRPELALYAEGPGVYPVTFFHIGRYFPKKVAMYALSEDAASEILYHPDYFDMPADSVAHSLPEDVGFAGFRFQESRQRDDWKTQDWAAFLGASYFRAIGELNQYGLSARGVTIDTAVPGPEEFPDFVEFYFSPGASEADPVTVLALLDGPSIAGAYRFQLWRTKGVIMEVDAQLFLRRDVLRLGLAPLTSMFWYAEQNRTVARDWRPEIHDSDGLALWTGRGERLTGEIEDVADGRVFMASDALKSGLIDETMQLQDAIKRIKEEQDLRDAWVVTYNRGFGNKENVYANYMGGAPQAAQRGAGAPGD